MHLKGRKKNLTILLFGLTYMVSYVTRINYGAAVSEMEEVLTVSKQMLSMALTGSFITYGVGQIIVGVLGERIRPKRLILIGLTVTTLMNLLIPFCGDPWLMTAVWSVNGFAQAFMWPPIVKFMSELFSDEDYKRASFIVSCGSSVGTMAIYFIVPLLISSIGWRSVFFFSAGCGCIMAAVFHLCCVDIEVKPRQAAERGKERLLSPLLVGIMLAIICMGMLRDGITTWMPSYISEIYDKDNSVAILSGVILPVFSMLCYGIASILHKKGLKNPITCACAVFFLGAVSSVMLVFVSGKSTLASILSMAVITGSMHGVNLMLISFVPRYFIRTGRVSTVSGVLNSCTYVGSAISTYGVASLVDGFGWDITIIIWMAVAVVGSLTCLICIAPWRKKFMQ